jgi:hypothetical protein
MNNGKNSQQITELFQIDSEEIQLIEIKFVIFLLWKTQSFDLVEILYCWYIMKFL